MPAPFFGPDGNRLALYEDRGERGCNQPGTGAFFFADSTRPRGAATLGGKSRPA